MTTFRAVRVAVSLVVATIGLTGTAAAQANDEIFPTLQWNFSTPGARANGMGRTFIGLADDATAAITNPAGLVSLTRPQVYLEFKNTGLKVDRLAAVDSFVTLQPTTFESTVKALSFLSVSAPINDRLAVGFSVHRFLDYHEKLSLAPRAIPNHPTGNALFPVEGSVDFTATSFGGSVAYMVTTSLRVGVTVAGNRFEADSVATRRRIIFGPNYRQGTGDKKDLAISPIIANETKILDTQNAMSASIGALYKVNEMVNIGFNYAKSPRFKTTENLRTNPGSTVDLALATNQPLTQSPDFPMDVSINVPDHFGVGVAIRPNTRLLIVADAVRMNYSSLSENTTLVFEFTGVTSGSYSIPDVTELHVGAEYNVMNLMQGKSPVFVRAGVFTNPNHLVSFAGVPDPGANAIGQAVYNLLPRNDETSGTVGAGIVFGSRFQVDAAYVVGKEFVASAALRF